MSDKEKRDWDKMDYKQAMHELDKLMIKQQATHYQKGKLVKKTTDGNADIDKVREFIDKACEDAFTVPKGALWPWFDPYCLSLLVRYRENLDDWKDDEVNQSVRLLLECYERMFSAAADHMQWQKRYTGELWKTINELREDEQ